MAVIVLREKLKIDDVKNHEKFLKKTNLFFSGRLRWNLFVLILAIGLIIMPLFIPAIATLAINGYFVLSWLIFLTLNTIGNFKIRSTLRRVKDVEANAGIKSKYQHIMATFAYKEPLALLQRNLSNVLSLNGGKDVIMVICLEEKTPDLDKKIKEIEKDFDGKFAQLIVTVHPYGVEGDIPGKCSNCNYGIRSLYNHLKSQHSNLNTADYMLTNFDVDTVFHKNYLDILNQSLDEQTRDISTIVFQPLLYYNWNLDKLSFFTRQIGILRSTMMCGALVPFNLNIMSVYSASLKLWVDGNFTHPFYQMDDIICYIRWTIVSGKFLRIKPIYCPTLSGPTSGENWRVELSELLRQGRRWSIGSAEVFHYFMCKLRRMNLFYAFIWAINYLNYYVVILCAQSLMMFATTIRLALIENEFTFINYIFLALPVLYYVFNAWIMIVNRFAVKSFLHELGVVEKFGFFRQLAHWITFFPTQIFYSLIVLYGFFEILVKGKKVCKHGASKKENLVRQTSKLEQIVRKLSHQLVQ